MRPAGPGWAWLATAAAAALRSRQGKAPYFLLHDPCQQVAAGTVPLTPPVPEALFQPLALALLISGLLAR